MILVITKSTFDQMQIYDTDWTSIIVIYGLLEYFLGSGTMCDKNKPFLLEELEFLQFYQ
jgi:hypothetical protein